MTDFSDLKHKNLEQSKKEASDGRLFVSSLPCSLYMDLTLKCNLKCPSCFRQAPENKGKRWPTMDRECFDHVAEELFPSAYRVILSGGGESLLHPHFDYMLEQCLEYQVRPVLYSNALLLKPDRLRILARAGTVLGLSIDSVDPETFEALRPPARWSRIDEILDNVSKIREEIAEPLFFPYFGVVIQRDNLDNLKDIVDYAADHGFEVIRFNQLVPYYEGIRDLVPKDEDMAKSYVELLQRANERKVRVTLPGIDTGNLKSRIDELRQENETIPISLDRDNPDRFVIYPREGVPYCAIPWAEAMITPDANVAIGCCSGKIMGDLSQESFSQIWNGYAYWRLRKTVNSKKPLSFCEPEECPFRFVNREEKTLDDVKGIPSE